MFARVAQWLANEIIVKGLANNPAFQRFAVRSSEQAKNLTKQASEAAKNLAESESVMQMRKVRHISLLLSADSARGHKPVLTKYSLLYDF